MSRRSSNCSAGLLIGIWPLPTRLGLRAQALTDETPLLRATGGAGGNPRRGGLKRGRDFLCKALESEFSVAILRPLIRGGDADDDTEAIDEAISFVRRKRRGG